MNGIWLIRLGSLLNIFAFFLPGIGISVDAGGSKQTSYSLARIAGTGAPANSLPILYMVPLCMLAVFLLSFLKTYSYSQAEENLWGQAAAVIIAAGSLVIGLGPLVYSPIYNLFPIISLNGISFLIIGFFIIISGLVLQWSEIQSAKSAKTVYTGMEPFGGSSKRNFPRTRYRPTRRSSTNKYANFSKTQAYFEMVRGARVISLNIRIRTKDYSIGRAKTNDLPLFDETVSYKHARVRYAQEGWFIQDQNSLNGTYVNGRRIGAARIHPGDVIAIGRSTFVFHTN
jgi:hypothetical protein